MNEIVAESLLILALLLANGVFAMAELAVVCARKSILKRLADGGNARARTALELAESPTRFLSTVQIGITLVGILAGAFGGATIAEEISRSLQTVPALAPHGDVIGLGIVVVAISYFSLVFGELLPKRLALSNPERVAVALAPPMQKISALARPVVRLLSLSTDGLLALLGIRGEKETAVSEDEVKLLVREGYRAGVFRKVETEMVESVLELDQLQVREIMTPRTKVIWINREDPHDAIWHKIVVSNHSHFPVYEGNRDNAVGILSVKAIYANLAAGTQARTSDLMVKPLIVPTTQTVIELLDAFKQSGVHVALVADEFGGIAGLVTLNDVMESIVGEFPSAEERLKPEARKRDDGSWLIDAMIDIGRVEEVLAGFQAGTADSGDYQTLAGWVVKQLGHVPREGETLEAFGYIFEVLDMDRHRVDKVLVTPIGRPTPPPPPAG